MTQKAITVSSISKSYLVRKKPSHDTFSGNVLNKVKSILQRDRDKAVHHALKNVSFEVEKGEVFGIIGHNGAGKSTLLKILSRIVNPDSGRIEIYGQMASLLEVGTGFHGDLSGRENIFLNGHLLGMSAADISARLDEIISFSEIEAFIDTPIKWYSSGMKMRLAFAIAAHLRADILLLDEILAVGDASFQRKCLAKMDEIARSGRTILFVSHALGAVKSLCNQAICLDKGEIIHRGKPEEVINKYLNGKDVNLEPLDEVTLETMTDYEIRSLNPTLKIKCVSVTDDESNFCRDFTSDQEIHVSFDFDVLKPISGLVLVVVLVNGENQPVLTSLASDDDEFINTWKLVYPGTYSAGLAIQPNLLGTGQYYITFRLVNPDAEHIVLHRVIPVKIQFQGYNNVVEGGCGHSVLRPKLHWNVKSLTSRRPAIYQN
ncbi:MAG: polysaccharide ABC transporter ATP-binding protein [Bacteroidota bacterium]|nr:polysaccharide ABC transporter ATP-binding protein [Bacteroidota bacterium]